MDTALRTKSPRTLTLDLAVPVALFAAVELARGTSRYRLVVAEDGVLEWSQVVGFAVAAWALVAAGRRLPGLGRWAAFGAAALVVGVIGEELAWGTRLAGAGWDLLEANNEQGDTTLHNLPGGLETSFVGLALVALALAVAVLLRVGVLRSVPSTLALWLAIPALYSAYRVGAGPVPYEVAKLSEAAEALFAAGLARVALAVRAEARRGADAPDPEIRRKPRTPGPRPWPVRLRPGTG